MQDASFLHGLLDPLSAEDVFSLPKQLVMTGGESLLSHMSWRERRPTERRVRGVLSSHRTKQRLWVGGPGYPRGIVLQQRATLLIGAKVCVHCDGPCAGQPGSAG